MRIAILGSGAVGGYYGALLARSGHDVTFIARGAHLEAIRKHGLQIRGPLGEFAVKSPAESDTNRVGPVEFALVSVKTYDNGSALPLLRPLVADATTVLTVQNGVDSAAQVAEVVGEPRTLGGTTYIATVIESPGVIVQTGTHRRVVFGEVFGKLPRLSERVERLRDAMVSADIQAEAVPDGRVPIWEKFVFLASVAGFAGASRLAIGPIWSDPIARTQFLEACREIERVARAEDIPIAADVVDRISGYVESIPGTMRASLLADLSRGKPIEVEALQGTVVRRGERLGVPTPVMKTLYAILRPHAAGGLNM